MTGFNRIKIVLAEHDKTNKWLSIKLEKSLCTVSNWCTNKTQPDLKTLNDIAKVLEIDVTELITSNKKK